MPGPDAHPDPERHHLPADGGLQRVPPQNLDAEQSVLGGMLLSKEAIADVIDVLTGRDFYRPAHETIYETVLELFGRGEPADPITVADELTKRGLLNRTGGAAYLHALVQAVPTAANAGHYADIVKEKSQLRDLIVAGARVQQMAWAQEGDAREIINSAQEELTAAVQTDGQGGLTEFGQGLAAALDALEALGKNSRTVTGLPTGFTELDSLTQGFHPGQLIIVAGRPALGKSTLALDFTRAAAVRHRLAAVFFSLEMSRSEITNRLLSAEAKVGLHRMRSGRLTESDWDRLSSVAPRVADIPLHIDDSPDLTLASVRAKARRLASRTDLRLIVIDYLQLMQSGGGRRPESRQAEVSEISRSLKLLAKELDLPVIALSQLNRGPEQRIDKKPMMSDLRESGSLEQDADLVILVHRDDAYHRHSPRAGEADLLVAKHRNGATAEITVAAQLHYSRFVDMTAT